MPLEEENGESNEVKIKRHISHFFVLQEQGFYFFNKNGDNFFVETPPYEK